ncbi:hypothetical protein RB195_020383 [Necator americanus]|uniref:Uncharacterized protein n=1 Tax=Necator americanus TaxID=51031 RepID=A0ABR1CK30_NECAM
MKTEHFRDLLSNRNSTHTAATASITPTFLAILEIKSAKCSNAKAKLSIYLLPVPLPALLIGGSNSA